MFVCCSPVFPEKALWFSRSPLHTVQKKERAAPTAPKERKKGGDAFSRVKVEKKVEEPVASGEAYSAARMKRAEKRAEKEKTFDRSKNNRSAMEQFKVVA